MGAESKFYHKSLTKQNHVCCKLWMLVCKDASFYIFMFHIFHFFLFHMHPFIFFFSLAFRIFCCVYSSRWMSRCTLLYFLYLYILHFLCQYTASQLQLTRFLLDFERKSQIYFECIYLICLNFKLKL